MFSAEMSGLCFLIASMAGLRSPYMKLYQPMIEPSTNLRTTSGLVRTSSLRVSTVVL